MSAPAIGPMQPGHDLHVVLSAVLSAVVSAVVSAVALAEVEALAEAEALAKAGRPGPTPHAPIPHRDSLASGPPPIAAP